MYIPKSTIKKILKEAGAQRVSDDAAEMFHRDINRMAFTIATRAVRLAKHAKRKTIGASDVKLANTN
ncbi:MAG: histone [Candidatus Micrarchaeales archaeon]